MRLFRPLVALSLLVMVAGCKPKEEPAAVKKPLKIAYSDWPGWTAFEIAIQKGWFKEAGVDVEFSWFEYAPSMDAFTAGKVDAVTIASCDALVTGAQGGKNVAILVTDFSNGNDMIVAKPGIATLKDLKGKKVGLEIGLVEHLLLLKGLQLNGMHDSDVKLVATTRPRRCWPPEMSMPSAPGSPTPDKRSNPYRVRRRSSPAPVRRA